MFKNEICKYANNLIKSDYMKTNPHIFNDFQQILNGNCIYIPNFFCKKDDFNIILDLAKDIQNDKNSGVISWSKHFKYENPEFSPTFNNIIKKMQDYFDIDVYHTRINFYKDGLDWKPFHHDSHAYGNKSLREDFTMGASFGASRELAILHEKTDQIFSFPQNNGDIFAFTSDVNKVFKHGVPKSKTIDIGPRFSIIAWGRRKNLNSRNSGNINDIILNIPKNICNNINNDDNNNINNNNTNASNSTNNNTNASNSTNNISISSNDIYILVENMINKFKNNKDKLNKKNNRNRTKNRVQSNYMKIYK